MDTKSKIKWDPFCEGYFENPYLHLNRCRTENPIQEVFTDSYLFFRYDDVNRIITNKNYKVHSISDYLGKKEQYIFKNTDNACPFLKESTKLWPMYLNDKIHKRIRTSISKAFYALPIGAYIKEAIDDTNHYFKGQKSLDLVKYCDYYIFSITKNVFNFSNEVDINSISKLGNLLAKSQDLFIPKQVYLEINEEILKNKKLFNSSRFKDVILSETIDLNLTEDNILSIMLISFMASFETSKDNLVMGINEILRSRTLTDFVLSATTENIISLNEEILRFTSPLQYTIRINDEELEIGNRKIKENSKLYLCIASANRDDSIFEYPDSIVPNRKKNNHLSFGAGPHVCLGQVLARKEMELAIQPMISFLKDYILGETLWSKQIFIRTIQSLKATLI